MTRLISVIGLTAITVSYFCANGVLAACTVNVTNTTKTQDVSFDEVCLGMRRPTLIIIKEVTWSIA